MTESHGPDVAEHVSSLSFDATLGRLVEVIEKAGMTVFATIDHAAGARNAGLDMPPATVLIYGNPKGGTPLMLASPVAALDLPLRVLVQARDGRVVIAFHPIAATMIRAGVPAEAAARLEPAQRLLVGALAS